MEPNNKPAYFGYGRVAECKNCLINFANATRGVYFNKNTPGKLIVGNCITYVIMFIDLIVRGLTPIQVSKAE
jgi:hypothetical protein